MASNKLIHVEPSNLASFDPELCLYGMALNSKFASQPSQSKTSTVQRRSFDGGIDVSVLDVGGDRIGSLDNPLPMRAIGAMLAPAVGSGGLGTLELGHDPCGVPRRNVFSQAGHYMGRARMSHDPNTCVVDGNAEVWGIKGLFVADPAVFPTCGFTNLP